MGSSHPHVVCTIAARMTSTRLPGKVLKPIMGRPSLDLMLERVRRTSGLSTIVVATTTNKTDEPIIDLANQLGYQVFRGSEHDVLGRIAGAARKYEADVLVELTSDCIAIDPIAIKQCIDEHLQGGADYTSNSLIRTYPVGMDTHIFPIEVILESERLAISSDEREHVGLYIYRRPENYRLRNVTAPANATEPNLHLTLDTAEDYAMLTALFEGIYPENPNFTSVDVINFLRNHPEIVAINQQTIRNKSASEYFAENG